VHHFTLDWWQLLHAGFGDGDGIGIHAQLATANSRRHAAGARGGRTSREPKAHHLEAVLLVPERDEGEGILMRFSWEPRRSADWASTSQSGMGDGDLPVRSVWGKRSARRAAGAESDHVHFRPSGSLVYFAGNGGAGLAE